MFTCGLQLSILLNLYLILKLSCARLNVIVIHHQQNINVEKAKL